MSTTERYGTIVWRAACELARRYGPVVTIGEVAAEGEVSQPTAKKYLDKLVELGHINRYITRTGIRVYFVHLDHCEAA